MEFAAASVGFAGLGIQVIESARKLFMLYEDTKDAPRRLHQAAASLQLLGEILGSLPKDEPSEDASANSSLLGRCKAECDKSVARIDALVDHLATRIVSRPRIGRLYAALKGAEMTAVLDELAFERSNLSLAFDVFRYHEQRRNAGHLEQIMRRLAIMPVSPDAVTTLGIPDAQDTTASAGLLASYDYTSRRPRKRKWQFRLQLAVPLLTTWKTWQLSVAQSCGGFDFMLRTQTLRPKSAEIFTLARAGDLSGIKELTRGGQASLLDAYKNCFERVTTILDEAADAGHVELCCWILQQESWYLTDEHALLLLLGDLMREYSHTSLTFLLQLANLEVDLFPEDYTWMTWWPLCPIQAQPRALALFHEAYQSLHWRTRCDVVANSRAVRDAGEKRTSDGEDASLMNILESLIPAHMDKLHPVMYRDLLSKFVWKDDDSHDDRTRASRQAMTDFAAETLRASPEPLQVLGVVWDSLPSIFYGEMRLRITRSQASMLGVLADDIVEFIEWWKRVIKNAGIDMPSYMEAEASVWSRDRTLALAWGWNNIHKTWGVPWELHYDPVTEECAVEVKPTIVVPMYRRVVLPGTFHASNLVPAEICWEPELTEEDGHQWYRQRDIVIDAQTIILREEKASSYLEDWYNYAQDDAGQVMLRRDLGTPPHQRRSRSQPCPVDRDRIVTAHNSRSRWMPSYHRGIYSSRLCFHHEKQPTFATDRVQTAEMLHDCASGKHMGSRLIWNPWHPSAWLSSVLDCWHIHHFDEIPSTWTIEGHDVTGTCAVGCGSIDHSKLCASLKPKFDVWTS